MKNDVNSMLPLCSITICTLVGDRELQKKRSCQCNACVWGLWSTTPLGLPSFAILFSEKSVSWDLMIHKGGAQQTLNEYCILLNRYFCMTNPGLKGKG